MVRNHLGDAKLVTGPARVTLWRSSVEKLRAHFAAEGEYLEINYKHGPRQCIAGPRLVFDNPIEVISVIIEIIILKIFFIGGQHLRQGLHPGLGQ